MTVRILAGDALALLSGMPDGSAHCCVTSPPYFGLRDYGVAGQMGLEETPDAYVAGMVAVFREVRRVLRDDGTLWLNIGDSYSSGAGFKDYGCKPKDLIGIPWLLAFALRSDGWYLRQDIIWAKPNPMPESVTDRCTKAHEYVFLMSKSARYHYDAEAIADAAVSFGTRRDNGAGDSRLDAGMYSGRAGNRDDGFRNARSVWSITTQPYSDAHFATMPPDLAERCIKAGCPEGGTVLDPFFGAGTTGLVADRLNRDCIGIELNPNYVAMAHRRIERDAPLFAQLDVGGAA